MGGGLFFAAPFLLGFLDDLGVSAAKAPVMRMPAFLSLAIGTGMLLLSLYGWWGIAHRNVLARAAIVALAIGFGLWLWALVDDLAGGFLPFYVNDDVFAILVGLASPAFGAAFWRNAWLPRSGLLLVGTCGLVGMALLAAPWPLGLGPLVPAVVIAYGLGWFRLGLLMRHLDARVSDQRGRQFAVSRQN
jgi:hypothetical protein